MTRAHRARFYDGWLYARMLEPFQAGLHGFIAERLLAGGLPAPTARDGAGGPVGTEGRSPRIVDIGCGTGSLALRLAGQAESVVGVDLSPAMVDYASRCGERQGAGNVSFVVGDVTRAFAALPVGHFDLAMIVLVLHEMPAAVRGPALREAARVATRVVCVDFRVPMPRNLAGLRNRILEVVAGREHFRAFRDYNRRGGTAGIAHGAGLCCRLLRLVDAGTLDVCRVARG